MKRLIEALSGAGCVAAMTGAGVSTLSGIPDFRGPQGLYRNPDAERIFDIDWFDRDPSVYYRGCRDLVYGLGGFRPGPVHLALKRLEDAGSAWPSSPPVPTPPIASSCSSRLTVCTAASAIASLKPASVTGKTY